MPDTKKQEKIAILGYGREGRAALKYLTVREKISWNDITVLDTGMTERPDSLHRSVDFIGGISAFDDLDDFSLIIKSPGIPPHRLGKYRDHPGLTSLARLFFEKKPGRIIAITGTKGKSTLASLAAHILREAGRRVLLLGNIGTPPLPAYDPADPPDHIVIEMSSYMLYDIAPAADHAILLNIYPDHLDWHGSFIAYRDAKLQIFTHARKKLAGAQIIREGYIESTADIEIFGDAGKYRYENGSWWRDAEPLFDRVGMRIFGRHVYENIASLLSVMEDLQISTDTIETSLKSFPGLPHRLQYIGTVDDIACYDDAISTTPESTIASLRAIADSEDGAGVPIGSVLLGGQDRGYQYAQLWAALASLDVSTVILFGEAGRSIRQHLPANVHHIIETDSMRTAVDFALAHTPAGRALVLSTAAPSYGIWRNFEEKGEEFANCIFMR